MDLQEPASTRPVRLTSQMFDDLAASRVGSREVQLLMGSERSRRLLLLQHLLTQCGRRPALLAPIGGLEPALALLAAVERHGPAALGSVLDYPTVGMWLAHTVRLVEGVVAGPDPLWVQVGGLASIAAAAALRCSLPFSIAVPVVKGRVVVPGSGCARFGSAAEVARVTATTTEVTVTAGGRVVGVTLPMACDGPGWQSVRVLDLSGSTGHALTIHVDDVDPAPSLVGLPTPSRLPAEALARWTERLADAWLLIDRDHPEDAQALAAGLNLIVPVDQDDPPGFLAGSSPDGFGAAALRLPDSTADLACALVHEFRHSVLNGLLHLVELHKPDRDGPVHYVPWRDDPRPFVGVLHGAYAFTGVTAFWRTRRERDVRHDAARAELEFAFWRHQTGLVLDDLAASPLLTETGRRMIEALQARIASWLLEPLDTQTARLALTAALSHRAGWRTHHVRADADWVEAAADAWLAGAEAPPEAARKVVIRDPAASGLGRMFALARHRLSGSAGPVADVLRRAEADDPRGADHLLIAGDPAGAVDLYLAVLADRPDDPRPWAGLGAALAETASGGVGAPVARALLQRPESVRAVHRRLLNGTVGSRDRPDVLALAGWLGLAC